MTILNYTTFKLLELKTGESSILPQNKKVNLKISDSDGEHFIVVNLTSYGWSSHREIIYYEFTVVESSSDFYRKGGLLILSLNFDKKENQFYFYPYFNESGKMKMYQMSEQLKKAYIEIY